MRLLLDTHIVLAVLGEGDAGLTARHRALLTQPEVLALVSVASLWEVAIKHRHGRLALTVPMDDLPERLRTLRMKLVPITVEHVLASYDPVPPTSDPFDRLLLAVTRVEAAALVTRDSRLREHPLAWRPA